MSYIYRPAHVYQLGAGSAPTGGVDCTSASAAMAFDRATLGGVKVSGRAVRLASNEPVPDPHSPGLNLPQVINVGFKWHIELVQRSGAPWASVIKALKEKGPDGFVGRGVILQGDYDQIPAGFSGQLSFKGDHAVYINHVTGDGDLYWLDPLRKAGAVEIPEAVAQKYAEKYARSRGVYPGVLFCTTRITQTISHPS